ncbi:SseB family protein [Streptomyces sulphureus]|uniref:SseB family protein n=1 Tax=Streptomyces sulphureus TaxID=47758 RepID=UPI00036133AA|nr:SseB family protein [Streptomyces sulphureus]
MATKNIPAPAFADDDGSADPELTAALAAWRADAEAPHAEDRVLEALAGARLLVPVVAVLTEEEHTESGLRQEKSSDMAVPTLTAPDGSRALPAFTSTDALARWRPDARPVAVPLRQALHALAQEGADTLLLDLSGPVAYEVTGRALRALATGRTGTPLAADPEVAAALRGLLADQPRVRAAHLAPGGRDSDGTLVLALDAEEAAPEVARGLADSLAADETLRAGLVHGLDLALLPPESELPAAPFYRRGPRT